MIASETNTRRVAFRTQMFGFDRAEVRAFLSNLVSEYEQTREQVESLTHKLAQEQDALSMQSAIQQNDVAHLVERTLASAHKVGDEIRKEAEQEAVRIIADAKTRGARLLEEAVADASERHAAAVGRLREVDREIERMQGRHRELRSTLESMVTALGETLADVRAHSPFDPTGPAEAHPAQALATER